MLILPKLFGKTTRGDPKASAEDPSLGPAKTQNLDAEKRIAMASAKVLSGGNHSDGGSDKGGEWEDGDGGDNVKLVGLKAKAIYISEIPLPNLPR